MAIMILPGTGRGTAAEGGGGGRYAPTLRRPEVYAARRARRELSLPEALLWQRLRCAPQGMRFRKQHPIGTYRADFYCAAAKLVVEIDGIAHDMGDRSGRDDRRAAHLNERGYHVLRIPATDVLKDPDAAATSIVACAANPLHHRTSRGGPPPRPGEDLDG